VVQFTGVLRPDFGDGFASGVGVNFDGPGFAGLSATGLAGGLGLVRMLLVFAAFQVSCLNRHDTI
jgi:hypothetical protein